MILIINNIELSPLWQIKENMKIIAMPFEKITGKDTRVWIKSHGITERGTFVEIFLSQKDFDAYGADEKNCLSKEVLLEMFETLPTMNVEFNEKGRIVGLK